MGLELRSFGSQPSLLSSGQLSLSLGFAFQFYLLWQNFSEFVVFFFNLVAAYIWTEKRTMIVLILLVGFIIIIKNIFACKRKIESVILIGSNFSITFFFCFKDGGELCFSGMMKISERKSLWQIFKQASFIVSYKTLASLCFVVFWNTKYALKMGDWQKHSVLHVLGVKLLTLKCISDPAEIACAHQYFDGISVMVPTLGECPSL